MKDTYGFKVGLRTDKAGWRTYDIYRWDVRHNQEILLLSTIAHGSLEQVQSLARDHVKLYSSQHATA